MKKLSLLLCLFVTAYTAQAQTYGNEWIDYSKKYFKIRTTKDGIHRINYATVNAALAAAGESITSINAADYQLWYRGQQVPLFIGNSVTTELGTLQPSDFIEFYGKRNDGWLDTKLYRNTLHQANPYYSLYSDTSCYYLTWDNTTTNARYTLINNNLVSPPTKENWYYHENLQVFSNVYYNGRFLNLSNHETNFPDYEEGEGWMGSEFSGTYNVNPTLTGLYTAGPVDANIETLIGGRAEDPMLLPDHNLKIDINSVNYVNSIFHGFAMRKYTFTVPVSILLSGANTVAYKSIGSIQPCAVSYLKIRYPHNYNFGGVSKVNMEVPSSVVTKYLEMVSFNNMSTAPLLIDFTNNIRIIGNTTASALQQFVLPASATNRKLFITSQSPSDIVTVTNMELRQFVDFSNPVNQGNYIILSHPDLYNDGTGHNYCLDYKNYRSSPAGGGYQTQLISVLELFDQFGYGTVQHAWAIRKFNDFAMDQWVVKPAYELFLGKSITYQNIRNSISNYNKCKVPTFGSPGGDMLLTTVNNDTIKQRISVGRISANNADQVRIYLEKLIPYEAHKMNYCSLADREWMKRIIHITAGNNPDLYDLILGYYDEYEAFATNTSLGAYIERFYKTSTVPIEEGTSALLDSFINNGSLLLTYWGHANSGLWEFDIGPAAEYNNLPGRYPIILSNSCLVGDIHSTNNSSMSEEFVLEEDKGAIAYVAVVSYGFVSYLHTYTLDFYRGMSQNRFRKGLGDIMRFAVDTTSSLTGGVRLTKEEFTLEGDPAINLPMFQQSDYTVKNADISLDPVQVTIEDDSFKVSMKVYNYGDAKNDTFRIRILRQLPSGAIDTAIYALENTPHWTNDFSYKIPVKPNVALGENKLFVKIDAGESWSECSETNNEATLSFFVFSNDVLPCYLCEGTILSGDCVGSGTLRASTSTPILPNQNYIFQIDTVPTYDSPLMETATITQLGGVVEWKPSFLYLDGQAYFWRVKLQEAPGAVDPNPWHDEVFVYYNSSLAGWAQTSPYQFVENDEVENINISLPSGQMQFVPHAHDISVHCGQTSVIEYNQLSYYYDNEVMTRGSDLQECGMGDGLLVAAFEPVYGKPLLNQPALGGPFGCGVLGTYNQLVRNSSQAYFEFKTQSGTAAMYNGLYNFLNTGIPNGYYFLIYSINDHDMDSLTSVYPFQNLVYTWLESQGLYGLRNVDEDHPFTVWGKKGDPTYANRQIHVADSVNQEIVHTYTIPGFWHKGSITTPPIGPAQFWSLLTTNNSNPDPSNFNDLAWVDITGITPNGQEVYLGQYNTSDLLTGINANSYPYIKLKYNTKDSVNYTPFQLNNWKVEFTELPEFSLSQNDRLLLDADTTEIGDTIHFEYMVRNLTCVPVTNLPIKITILDNNNVAHILPYPNINLAAYDSHLVSINIPNIPYVGSNMLLIDINSERTIPERCRFNNFAQLPFIVNDERINPLLDVTFDGIHILDGDIVSPKTIINIKLKDESTIMALDDTSLLDIKIMYPDQSIHPLYYSSSGVTFTPAQIAGLNKDNNEASVKYNSNFPIDGNYQLILKGRDKRGNPTGIYDYKIGFRIINKPMISSVLNYPNPFTTKTNFVFTLTGSKVPETIKIQVFTITGKIVKEITNSNLKNLKIGRNITDYSWDGTDQYGQRVGNGMYLYRVVAYLGGKEMDHFDTEADNYFTTGKNWFGLGKEKSTEYGKMYLMR